MDCVNMKDNQSNMYLLEEMQSRTLLAKYGGLTPKKHLLSKVNARKCFDSAEWALAKQGLSLSEQSCAAEVNLVIVESLPAKLTPTPAPPRRRTNLDVVDAEAVAC